MARLLIVSRSMALAMRVADQHEVVEHPADELETLLPSLDADVLVLDIGDPILAVNTVNGLREAEQAIPVMLISGYQPEWEQVEAQTVEGVYVVPLPITRQALLLGIAALTGVPLPVADPFLVAEPDPAAEGGPVADPGPAADPDEQMKDGDEPVRAEPVGPAAQIRPQGTQGISMPQSSEPPPSAPPPAPGSRPVAAPPAAARWARPAGSTPGGATRSSFGAIRPAAERAGAATPGDSVISGTPGSPAGPGDSGPGTGGMVRRIQRLGNRPRKLQRHPASAEASAPPGLVTDPLGPRTGPVGVGRSALDKRLDADAAAMLTGRSAGVPFAPRTDELVRMLLERAGELYGVNDTAQVLADDVIERADADAAAVLVPDDGPVWRVGGGVGLRPLERRLVLADSHWLITEIGSAGRAVLIDDTDIIRQQLAGAPLAAWRHLLAVPVPDVRAIVVLARGTDGGPFTDHDLSVVIAPVREAAALLAQALSTRELARSLAAFSDADQEVAARRPRPA